MKILTHSGSFHQDELFAVATLQLLFGEGEVIRTRDSKEFEGADYVVDVGLIHDPERGRFDHHQPGGAGVRQNGIPYASFGLVWKKFGALVAGNAEVADVVDKKMVQPIDATDTGVPLYETKIRGVSPYLFENVLNALTPSRPEEGSVDEAFRNLLPFARHILQKEIEKAKQFFEDIEVVKRVYRETADKRIIVFDRPYAWRSVLARKKEPMFVIFPGTASGKPDEWIVSCVPIQPQDKRLRRKLPEAWGGLTGAKLESVSGIKGADFVHTNRFVGKASSREAAEAMARAAL